MLLRKYIKISLIESFQEIFYLCSKFFPTMFDNNLIIIIQFLFWISSIFFQPYWWRPVCTSTIGLRGTSSRLLRSTNLPWGEGKYELMFFYRQFVGSTRYVRISLVNTLGFHFAMLCNLWLNFGKFYENIDIFVEFFLYWNICESQRLICYYVLKRLNKNYTLL